MMPQANGERPPMKTPGTQGGQVPGKFWAFKHENYDIYICFLRV